MAATSKPWPSSPMWTPRTANSVPFTAPRHHVDAPQPAVDRDRLAERLQEAAHRVAREPTRSIHRAVDELRGVGAEEERVGRKRS
jgi:hypothetical protein